MTDSFKTPIEHCLRMTGVIYFSYITGSLFFEADEVEICSLHVQGMKSIKRDQAGYGANLISLQ